jgi:hypothetical protein
MCTDDKIKDFAGSLFQRIWHLKANWAAEEFIFSSRDTITSDRIADPFKPIYNN